MRCLLIWLVLMSWPMAALARDTQDLRLLRTGAGRFLAARAAAAYPDSTAKIRVGSVDNRLRLAKCRTPVYFLASGSQLWGTGSLRVQCKTPAHWSLYLTYRVRLWGPALVARRPLPSHYTPLAGDLSEKKVEYTMNPGRYPRNLDALKNATLAMPLAEGHPITIGILRLKPIIRAGQRVRIVANGPGFQVSQEGIAQRQARVGDLLRLKLSSGRYVQGTVRKDGTVQVEP